MRENSYTAWLNSRGLAFSRVKSMKNAIVSKDNSESVIFYVENLRGLNINEKQTLLKITQALKLDDGDYRIVDSSELSNLNKDQNHKTVVFTDHKLSLEEPSSSQIHQFCSLKSMCLNPNLKKPVWQKLRNIFAI